MYTEFQERVSPHFNSFTWIFNSLNLQAGYVYSDFINKTVNAQLPEQLNNPELFHLVKV